MTETPWFVLRGALDGNTSTGESPDIILGGAKSDPAYAGEYGTAFSRTADYGATNHVYVRARNKGSEEAVGSVTVFAVHLAGLANQSQWLRLQTADGRADTNISAKPGEVGVSGAPLIWKPGEAPPPDAPWCLIAMLVGDGHPPLKVPITVHDKAGFDAWVAKHHRINYVVVEAKPVPPVESATFSWARKVDLGNDAEITLNASLTCTKGPPGGVLAFHFDADDSSGQRIGIGETPYTVNNAYSQTRTVPANFSSTLTVLFKPTHDQDGEADFSLVVATETGGSDDGELSDDGGLDDDTRTVVAAYTVSFGQTHAS